MGIALVSPCGAAPNAPDAGVVARSVTHELGAQDRLPSGEVVPVTDDERGAPQPAPLPAGSVDGRLGTALIVAGAVFAALFIIMSLADSAFGRELLLRRGAAAAARDESHPAGGPSASLVTADQLAAQGRYTEAMHQLLYDTVAALRRRLGTDIPDAFTSREILRALALQPAERDAFQHMIARVEQTWFAQRRAALDDYDAVRACFALVAAGAGNR